MTVGENIKNYRKAKSLTQKELAGLINVKDATITRYEKGDREPNMTTLQQIANALDVSINDLIHGTDTINLTTGDKNLKEMYSEFLCNDINFPKIVETIESCGYELLQNTNTWDVSIKHKDKIVATIPEKEFINFGKQMLTNIKRYTEFEVYKMIDDFYFLYNED